jgi:hypothetical protein
MTHPCRCPVCSCRAWLNSNDDLCHRCRGGRHGDPKPRMETAFGEVVVSSYATADRPCGALVGVGLTAGLCVLAAGLGAVAAVLWARR